MFKKKLNDVLYETKTVKIKGVRFKIRKIDAFHYLNGSHALQKTYDLYKTGHEEQALQNFDKVKKHYRDVFMASVLEPKLKRKEEEEGILVDDLFYDWDIANSLYTYITEFTYGKKKLM